MYGSKASGVASKAMGPAVVCGCVRREGTGMHADKLRGNRALI